MASLHLESAYITSDLTQKTLVEGRVKGQISYSKTRWCMSNVTKSSRDQNVQANFVRPSEVAVESKLMSP